MISMALVALTLIGSDMARPAGLRELICRGRPGIDLKVTSKPSPADPKLVRMTLRYSRSTHKIADNWDALPAGSCTWNSYGFPGMPVEPGFVHFDIPGEVQQWSATHTRQLDTTYLAAAFFPDTLSVPRYLGRSDLFWRFYVDDQTNVSISFGAYRNPTQLPKYVTISGSPAKTTPTVAELRCRGGAGIAFNDGVRVADNRVRMGMTYRIADREAGADAKGLAAGTCAYVKRDGMPRELAKIEFETAGNAQLVQARSGGTVDRSPNAAARYPDANTIPVYMQDPSHYWNFHVTVANAGGATSHAAWQPTVGIGTYNQNARTEASNIPGPGNQTRTGAGAKANTARVVDPPLIFREFIRKPNEYWMRFSARANSGPVVEYSSEAPTRMGNGKLGFRSPQTIMVKPGTTKNFATEYSTAPLTNIKLGKYYFVISVPAGPDGQPAREYSGEFTTTSQNVIVTFTGIDMLNDSDKDSEGELWFNFSLAPSPATTAMCNADGRGRENCHGYLGKVEWDSNKSYPVDIRLNINNVPNKVRVWVFGVDDDSASPSDVARGSDRGYGASGLSTSNYDQNTASGEIDITNYKPGTTYPFKLRSVDGSVLMFEVRGTIEVVRF